MKVKGSVRMISVEVEGDAETVATAARAAARMISGVGGGGTECPGAQPFGTTPRGPWERSAAETPSIALAGADPVEPKTWRYVLHGEARSPVLAFIRHVSPRGTVYFVKPNPWWDREGDGRAGWTREQVTKVCGVVADAMPTDAEIARVVGRIGGPA